MSTPEDKVKKFIMDRMKGWFPEAVTYAPPGGRFGKAGFPDRLWFIRASDTVCVTVAIEAKAQGNVATTLQINRLEKLKGQGVVCAVVTGKDAERMEMVRMEVCRRIGAVNDQLI
jgi:hypothetical protein